MYLTSGPSVPSIWIRALKASPTTVPVDRMTEQSQSQLLHLRPGPPPKTKPRKPKIRSGDPQEHLRGSRALCSTKQPSQRKEIVAHPSVFAQKTPHPTTTTTLRRLHHGRQPRSQARILRVHEGHIMRDHRWPGKAISSPGNLQKGLKAQNTQEEGRS
jgi:hypothetical protein